MWSDLSTYSDWSIHTLANHMTMTTSRQICHELIIVRQKQIFLGDKKINKSVYSWLLNHFNFLMTIVTDSKIDWDYYCLYMMIIHAFCQILSHFFCEKGSVPSHIVVSLIVLYYTKLIPTSKHSVVSITYV